MRVLQKPHQITGEVFAECIANMEDKALRASLKAITDQITEAAAEFERAGIVGQFYAIPKQLTVGQEITAADMTRVYANRFLRKRAPGRRTYDAIMAAVPHARCPLCALRTVSTLDHYLPKALFAALVFAPMNLVPACGECNRLKLDIVPAEPIEQTLHPYFDDVEQERWLYATVHETGPPALSFSVAGPTRWDAITLGRVQTHFIMFNLGELYASHAAEELANIRQQLSVLLGRAGPAGVRAHLVEQAASRAANHINSWQTATYEALSESPWYYSGGFRP